VNLEKISPDVSRRSIGLVVARLRRSSPGTLSRITNGEVTTRRIG
jgi:hypothetical protein